MLTIGSIVWGVKHYRGAIDFWSAALDYVPKREPDDDWALLVPRSGQGVQLAIQLVTSEARDHQRHHLDLYTKDQAAQVERLLSLGATRVDWRYPPDADYVVLADPDGNTFCVIDTSGDTTSEASSDTSSDTAGQATGDTSNDTSSDASARAPLPAPDAFAHRGARALVVLHERELRAFVPVWREAKAHGLRLPETDDADYDSLEHLLTHVLRAAGRYLSWVCKVLDLADPAVPPEPPLDQIEAHAEEYLEAVLTAWREPLRAVPAARFEDRTYATNWGAQLTIEAMLEHAVAHPLRHAFQLQELLRASRDS